MTAAQPARRRLPHIDPFVVAFLVGIATLTALRPLLRHIPEPPPVVGEVPRFSLIDQDGRRFERTQLLGRVTIANVFCSRCDSASNEVVNGMRRIAQAYKDRGIDRIGFLSVTKDPDVDRPARLREYARSIGADAGQWTFLTGGVDAAHDLAAGLFRSASPSEQTARNAASTGAIAADGPSKPLILIDQQARIRGWYGADEAGLDEVYNRAQHVLGQSARGR